MPYYVSFSTVQSLVQQAVTLPARLVCRTGGTAQYRTRETRARYLARSAATSTPAPSDRSRCGHLNTLNRYDTQAKRRGATPWPAREGAQLVVGGK